MLNTTRRIDERIYCMRKSKRQLARDAGYPDYTFQKLVTDFGPGMSIRRALQLADMLKVDLNWLVDESRSPYEGLIK